MITVTLLRHGQISANVDKAYAGSKTDQPLTEKGRQQAAALHFPAVDRVFISPMYRCRQTAEIAFPGMEYEVVDDFREMDFGIFEGKTAAQLSDSDKYRLWVDGMCQGQIPGGDSMRSFSERVTRSFEKIIAGCSDGDRIALVVHGGTIMSIMGAYNDEERQSFEYHLNTCEYYVCTCPVGGDIVLHRIGGIEPHGDLPPRPKSFLSAESIRAALSAGVSSALDIRVFDEIDSTNNEAKRLLADGLGAPALIVAARQQSGRGRRGRSFASPEGGIYLSLVLRGGAAGFDVAFLTMTAALAVVRAIESCSSCEPQIKWVNDIFVDSRKVCGILAEGVTDIDTGTIGNVVVGIGVNTSESALPDDLSEIAGGVSLNDDCDGNILIAAIVSELLALGAGVDHQALIEEYRARSLVIGKSIEYEERGETRKGRAIDIDEHGGLIVEHDDGTSVTLRGGDVSIAFEG